MEAMGADLAIMVSATFNGGHFWLTGIRTEWRHRVRRLAALGLALLHGGLALQAALLLAITLVHTAGGNIAPLLGQGGVALRIPALAGTLMVSVLLLRDRFGKEPDR